MHYLKIWLVFVMVTVILTSVDTESSSASDEKTKRRCKPNICKNGGKYVSKDSGKKRCRCVNGWTGKYCQEEEHSTSTIPPLTSDSIFRGRTFTSALPPLTTDSDVGTTTGILLF